MLYVIKNQLMATHLMSNGFRLIKMDVSKQDPNRNVYLFKDSPELRETMGKFKREDK